MEDTKTPKPRNTKIDWEAVELSYRMGGSTLAEMAATFNCSEIAIRKKAKKEGWTRDLGDAVKATTKAKIQQRVSDEYQARIAERAENATNTVEMAAASDAELIAEHEAGAKEARLLLRSIMAKIAEKLPDMPVEQAAAYVEIVKKAIEGHEKAVAGERKARNLDDLPPATNNESIEALLAEMQGALGG